MKGLSRLRLRLMFAYPIELGGIMTWKAWEPGDGMPAINRSLVYLGACIIAGLRLARERQVNTGVIPTRQAVDESIGLSHEIFTQVFRGAAKARKED